MSVPIIAVLPAKPLAECHSTPDGLMGGVQYRTVWNASARYPVWQMTKPPTDEHRDQDAHKGAMEEGRPQPQPNTSGLDKNGLPNNATAIAHDRVGANADKTQG
jgi:hypothetical protein